MYKVQSKRSSGVWGICSYVKGYVGQDEKAFPVL